MTGESTRPLISVITPVYRSSAQLLVQTVISVLTQDFKDWELCIVDDGSDQPELVVLLSELAATDERIRVKYRVANGGISAATNDGLAMAGGDYVAFLDQNDLFAPTALTRVAETIAGQPEADLIYTDEATSFPGGGLEPLLKPDWSPDNLETYMSVGHLAVYRRSVVTDAGGMRSEFDGSQDWDLALRVTELTDRVYHVPAVLYFHRQTATAATKRESVTAVTAESVTAVRDNLADQESAVDAGCRALEDRLARQGTPGSVESGPLPGSARVRRVVRGRPTRPIVSVIIPTAGPRRIVRGRRADLIVDCLTSVLNRTEYEPFEVVCVVDARLPSRIARYLAGLAPKVRVVETTRPFNFSHRINLGAVHARGDYLLLLNDDTEVIARDWMTTMMEVGQDAGVGAVGAKLLFDDGRVQHSGVTVCSSGTAHIGVGARTDDPGYLGMLALNTDRCAVTGACLLSPAEVFCSVGGLTTDFPLAFNDVDYCYKLRARGWRVVMVPAAELFHFESSTRVAWDSEDGLKALIARWPKEAERDPFYNPGFTGRVGDFGLPDIQLPDIQLHDIQLPDIAIRLADIQLPSLGLLGNA